MIRVRALSVPCPALSVFIAVDLYETLRFRSKRSSWHYRRLLAATVQPIEQELERAVWLRAEGDLGTEHIEMPASDVRFGDRDCALEIVLSPRPAAAQRLVGVEPRDWTHTLERCIRTESECRA